MKYLIFLLLPILVACGHNPTSPPQIEKIEVVKRIQVPAELLQACPELKSTNPSKIEDILLEDLDFIQTYGECRLRHKKLLGAIQEVVK